MALASNEISYIHRESSELRTERVYGERELRFLYETRLGSAILHTFYKRQWFSRLSGFLKRSSISRREIPDFIRRYEIDGTEAEFPATSYRSLDAFFARKLKANARPVDPDPLHLVAKTAVPAHGNEKTEKFYKS